MSVFIGYIVSFPSSDTNNSVFFGIFKNIFLNILFIPVKHNGYEQGSRTVRSGFTTQLLCLLSGLGQVP